MLKYFTTSIGTAVASRRNRIMPIAVIATMKAFIVLLIALSVSFHRNYERPADRAEQGAGCSPHTKQLALDQKSSNDGRHDLSDRHQGLHYSHHHPLTMPRHASRNQSGQARPQDGAAKRKQTDRHEHGGNGADARQHREPSSHRAETDLHEPAFAE